MGRTYPGVKLVFKGTRKILTDIYFLNLSLKTYSIYKKRFLLKLVLL